MKKGMRIVIVEDELIAAEFLREILEEAGSTVIAVIESGRDAITTCLAEKPEVVFMDVMLSDSISGCEAAVEISRGSPETRIIFLTAYVDEEMIEYAAQSHAAGYLTKPYNKAQILATLQLVTAKPDEHKRSVEKTDKVFLAEGYVWLETAQRLVKENREVPLGPTAVKLLSLLCSQPGISISNEQIAMHVWGKEVNDKTLRSLIHRIRAATHDDLIQNVSKTGYLIRLASYYSPDE